MSQGISCKCPEAKRPIDVRRWGLIQRNGNASAFNGYRWTPSDYSAVHCLICRATWRTKAAFVNRLPDMNIDSGDYAFTNPEENEKRKSPNEKP